MHGLYISLIILFLHATTWDGHIFEGIKKIIPPKDKIYKAIYGCPICMTPWWGTLIYLFFYRNCLSFTGWLWHVGAAAGLSVLWVCIITVRKLCLTLTKKIEED